MIQEQQSTRSLGFPWTDHLVKVLMDGLPLAVCIHDATGAIVDFNKHAANLWGGDLRRGDKNGRYAGFRQLYYGDGAPVPLAASPVSRVIETGQAVADIALSGERNDGSMRPLLFGVLPLSARGSITGAISCFHVVAGDFHHGTDEQREWETMSRFCASLGHDLANLFQVARLNVNLIERRIDPDQESLRKPVRGMGQMADRGLLLTRQLLAYTGKQHLDYAAVDINQLMTELLPQLASLAGPLIEVSLRLASPLWPTQADPEQIGQAVINIVANACDAMPGGGKIVLSTAFTTLPAETGVRAAGDYGVISIADTGPGMDRQTLGLAFQPYFSTKQGAQGLGLSTSLGIVRQHRGDVRIDSRPGQGTCVTLSLPRSMSDLPRRAVPLRPAPVKARGRAVLVVDDDAVVRAAAVDMLESEGFEVMSSATGEEALCILRSGRAVDLLLADVQMAAMSGIELLHQARNLRPNLPGILISGMGAIGVDPAKERVVILQKPLRAEEFLRRVTESLSAA